MSLHEHIIQGTRRWLKLACSITDEQVVVGDTDQVRPDKPYLTVKLIVEDTPVGQDEQLQKEDNDGVQRHVMRGARRATASVQGFGVETADWLTLAYISLENPLVRAQLDEDELSIRSMTGTNDISEKIGTEFEKRFSRDFEILYGIETTEGPEVNEAQKLDLKGDFEDPANPTDALEFDLDVEVS